MPFERYPLRMFFRRREATANNYVRVATNKAQDQSMGGSTTLYWRHTSLCDITPRDNLIRFRRCRTAAAPDSRYVGDRLREPTSVAAEQNWTLSATR